jgi:hypothetical protein
VARAQQAEQIGRALAASLAAAPNSSVQIASISGHGV